MKLRGTEDVSLDMQEMQQEQEKKKTEPEWSFRELLRTKELRTPLFVICALAMCQQLSGINVVRGSSHLVPQPTQFYFCSHCPFEGQPILRRLPLMLHDCEAFSCCEKLWSEQPYT